MAAHWVEITVAAMVLLWAIGGIRTARDGEIRVVDGDTVDFRGRRLRLGGIDAPEWNQPHGNAASNALRARLKGQGVLVVMGKHDHYGRRLAWLWTGQGSVNRWMVSQGHAHSTTLTGLLGQIGARLGGRGLWRRGGAINPGSWRRWH